MEELGRAGIEAEEMAAGGRALNEARGNPNTRQRDIAATRDVAGRAGTGGMIGLLSGAVVALVVLLVLGTGSDSAGFWIGVLGAAIAGAAVGGMIGGVRKLPLAQEWELTYDVDGSQDRSFRVAVRTADQSDVGRAREVLEAAGAQKVEQQPSAG